MNVAINLLCNTVKATLGPKGNNVIIDHSTFSPFITNDGVTIASNIESDDEVINTILNIAKEASIKTNEIVGDGTTTTLVLLQSIFNEGMKLIDNGINPIILKEELNYSLNKLIIELKKLSIKPSKSDLLNISITSSNSETIGKIITDTFLKVKNINSISINENNTNNTEVLFSKGYSFSTNLASLYYFKDKSELYIKEPFILLFNMYLDNLEIISNIINDIISKKRDLIIIAKDYNDDLINQVISFYMDEIVNIYLFKTNEYGINELIFLKDISVISDANIIDSLNDIKVGIIKSIKINKNISIIEFNKNENINNLIKEIKKEINNNLNVIDKDFNNKRLSMLTSSLAEIKVGANTTCEKRELIMRYTDALCAINASLNGITLGSGITFFKLSENLEIENNADKILKLSLTKPFYQILKNSGLQSDLIIKIIKENNFNILYNVKNNSYEDINTTTVIDPIDVLINSLKNAISIAGMLLTTSSLIINEYNNNLNKINDFNEL